MAKNIKHRKPPAPKVMHEDEVMESLASGSTAEDLLDEADPSFARRFNHIDTLLVNLLKDVKRHFPDAEYFTASGGFNLMLAPSHSSADVKIDQRDAVACSGCARIGDGDF